MTTYEFDIEKALLIRVPHDEDLIDYLTQVAKEEGIESGSFTAIGAVKEATIGFYDQEDHEYTDKKLESPLEIVNCTGNISYMDGEPFAHAHAILSDHNYQTVAGHLSKAKVFAAEVNLLSYKGDTVPERKHDEITDLTLWSKE